MVKELGPYVPRLPGIVGATILGDGTVTPVLDLPELMRGFPRHAVQEAPVVVEGEVERATPHLPL